MLQETNRYQYERYVMERAAVLQNVIQIIRCTIGWYLKYVSLEKVSFVFNYAIRMNRKYNAARNLQRE